jgi:hypothetical protein
MYFNVCAMYKSSYILSSFHYRKHTRYEECCLLLVPLICLVFPAVFITTFDFVAVSNAFISLSLFVTIFLRN